MANRNCFISTLTTLLILGGAGFGIWWFLGKPNADEIGGFFGDLGDNFGEFWENDPFSGNSSKALMGEWPNSGKGLQLEILNACDDTWETEFTKAILDWDNGEPDALTLTTERVAVEPACSQKDDVMKVCNDNYGKTGWLGINELLTNTLTGIIQSSVAKMNEYYLKDASFDERLYTMCHEVGHGFGLPHTDENFINFDKGDCLDYTNTPSNNLDPGKVNFDKLLEAYGPARRRLLQGTSPPSSSRSPLSQNQREAYRQAIVDLEEQLLRQHQEENENSAGSNDWRLLRTLKRGEHYVRDIGDGYQIEARVLRPIVKED